MAKIDKKYHKLLNTILDKGRWYEDPNRKGVKRLQIPHYSFEYNLKDGFPAITTKKLYWKAIVVELLWFLKGDTNIKYLVDNNINIWNKDAYNWYLKNSREDSDGHNNSFEDYIDFIKNNDKLYDENMTLNRKGDLGRIYGAQWRDWNKVGLDNDGEPVLQGGFDQISNLIKNLKEKPLATDHIVTAWNPAELNDMSLPPCHKGFQLMVYELNTNERLGNNSLDNLLRYFLEKYSEEEINDDLDHGNAPKYGFDLVWEQRSVDTFLGLPFNIASYALLAGIIGKMTNMIPGKIIGDLRNVHIYDNSMESVKKQLSRDVNKYNSSKVNRYINEEVELFNTNKMSLNDLFNSFEIDMFELENYKSYNNIKAEMLSKDV